MESRSWQRSDSDQNWQTFENRDWPIQRDKANDDASNDSSSLNGQYFYSADGPGIPFAISNPPNVPQQLVLKSNFEEYLRVSFNGKRPTGNMLNGSRMSEFYEWHNGIQVDDNQNGVYERVGDNEIGPGHITLSAP